MDVANASEAQLPAADDPSSNCCWTTPAPPGGEEDYPGLEDSTHLPGVRAALILAYGTIITLGVGGNAMVIHAVFRFRRLRTVTNFFIANLALADLLVASLCLPFTLAYTLRGEWAFGRALCFAVPCAQGAAVHVSTITLNVIAVDRLRNVALRPDGAPRLSRRACGAVVAIAWAVGVLLASPLAVFREYAVFQLAPGKSIQVCAEKWPETGGSAPYSLAMMLLQYGLPLAVNVVAYARIWSKMNAGRLSRAHRRRRKTTKMLVTVVAVFAVSWLPLHAFQLAVDVDGRVGRAQDFKLLFSAFHAVAMCSTFVNPILYGWMNNNYRSAFLDACSCYRTFDRHKKPNKMASAPPCKSNKG
ncbi:neuropeptide Y receptor type 2-like isoform X2 [Syngnathoides biaculeatus]|nr:neuropeptide Y receptor type 2-like isoform X2 [Syngnathoides biaculeatus]XP_061686924.1 neuropeptide Y receptor type 2-like isoform X2 [Syngnathoides biaculeatus]